jgi:AhpD family alkylhydroperoxidase
MWVAGQPKRKVTDMMNGLKWAVLTVMAAATMAGTAGAAEPRSAEATATLAEVKQMLGAVPAMVSQQPDDNVAPFWEQVKSLQLNPKTALSGKTKELIGLGVSAQVPCKYCVYAHTEFAKLNGANEREIKEAVAAAALARELSALSNGQSDDKATDVKTSELAATYTEIDKAFGPGHDFFKRYPAAALPALWKQVKAVTFNGAGALSVKDKLLISLAVASQIPSAACVKDYSGALRSNGASEQEIQEAVAMAGFTRSASTTLNGMQTDEASWKRDIDQIVKHVMSMSKRTAAK